MEKNKALGRWNLMGESTPKMRNERISERVLCATTSGNMLIGYLYNGEWFYESKNRSFDSYGYTVTHWHELPSHPLNPEQ